MEVFEYYDRDGFVVVKDLFTSKQLDDVQSVVLNFHQSWKKANKSFYQETAINSAYLTSTQFLDDAQRQILFNFISCEQLIAQAKKCVVDPAFLNTQLFFDPVNPSKKNYWHRDIQYGADHEKQKAILEDGPFMPHFRIPLNDEKGLELIPGTHQRWDTKEELNVRMEQNGRHSHDNLPGGKIIELSRGDLLVFSAKMLHRGIYGNDRLALDILLADGDSPYLQSVQDECLPDENMLNAINNPEVFERTWQAKAHQAP